jgi:hypothetical protein
VWPPAGKDEVLTCRIWPGSHEGSDDAHGRLAGPYGAEPDARCYGMTEAMWPEPSPDDRPGWPTAWPARTYLRSTDAATRLPDVPAARTAEVMDLLAAGIKQRPPP